MYKIRLLLSRHLGFSSDLADLSTRLLLLICISFRFPTKLVTFTFRVLRYQQPGIRDPSSHNMYRREHSAIRCQYMCSPHVPKTPWQSLNRFHLLLQTSGKHCIYLFILNMFRNCALQFTILLTLPNNLSSILTFPFLLLEELSNIIYSCLRTLTVVQNLV